MLQFGLRLGAQPRQLITTTPRPIALLKRLMAAPSSAVTRAPTRANAFNLAPGFLQSVMERYHGTRLGRRRHGLLCLGRARVRHPPAQVGGQHGQGLFIAQTRKFLRVKIYAVGFKIAGHNLQAGHEGHGQSR